MPGGNEIVHTGKLVIVFVLLNVVCLFLLLTPAGFGIIHTGRLIIVFVFCCAAFTLVTSASG